MLRTHHLAQVLQWPLFGRWIHLHRSCCRILSSSIGSVDTRPVFVLGVCCVWMVGCVCAVIGAAGLAASYNSVTWFLGIKGLVKDCFHIGTALLKGAEQNWGLHFTGLLLMVVTLSGFCWVYMGVLCIGLCAHIESGMHTESWGEVTLEGKVARMGQPSAHLCVGKRTLMIWVNVFLKLQWIEYSVLTFHLVRSLKQAVDMCMAFLVLESMLDYFP